MSRNLAAIAGLVITSQLSLAATVLEHRQGEVTLEQPPQSVAVYDMGILDTLDALQVPVVGLPKDFAPSYLAQYRSDDYAHIGSLFEPDIESLAALRPDLILIGNRSSTAYDDLSRLAPTADFTVWGEGFLDQFRETTRTLGVAFDKTAEAEAHIERIDAKLEQARSLARNVESSLLVMTSGGRLTAYGPGSRFAILHDEVGLPSVAADLEKATHGDPISFEYILEKDPQYIFVLDRDSAIDASQAGARELMNNALMQRTQAYQNDRIVYLDSVAWYIVMSGVQAVDIMVSEVLAALSR